MLHTNRVSSSSQHHAHHLFLFLALLVATSLCLPKSAFAQSEFSKKESLGIMQLTKGAELVLVGKVTDVSAKRIGKKIISFATVEPKEVLKGNLRPGATVAVGFLGGSVGNITQQYSHEIELEEGENAALFLVKSENKYFDGVYVLSPRGRVQLTSGSDPEERFEKNRQVQTKLKQLIDLVKGAVK